MDFEQVFVQVIVKRDSIADLDDYIIKFYKEYYII